MIATRPSYSPPINRPPSQRKADGLSMQILRVVARECRGNVASLSVEEITIFCWREWPAQFGLKDYADLYPDNNKVTSCLANVSGPVRLGWIRKTAPKTYELTDAGREVLASL